MHVHAYRSFTRNWGHHFGVGCPQWCADGTPREGARGGCPQPGARRRRGTSQGVHTRLVVDWCALPTVPPPTCPPLLTDHVTAMSALDLDVHAAPALHIVAHQCARAHARTQTQLQMCMKGNGMCSALRRTCYACTCIAEPPGQACSLAADEHIYLWACAKCKGFYRFACFR
eukprot:361855-Chlamydomonas_euryale.AAC.1